MTETKTQIKYCSIHEVLATATQGFAPESMMLFCFDENIVKLYPEMVESLKKAFPKIQPWMTKAGEATKTWEQLQKASEFFLAQGIHREAHLIAFGGGACTDFAGLLAGTLLRGLSWSNVPTTLLAMVDAAIGGKTAINSDSGKNLFGVFHLPKQVTICEDFLDTLPEEHTQSGLGEVVKYGLLSTKIHQAITSKAGRSKIYALCASHKQELVESDFKEQGPRKSLNLGHTIGHGLEKMFKPPHGIAVFWGLVLEHHMFKCKQAVTNTITMGQLLGIDAEQFPLPKLSDQQIETLIGYVSKDKKLSQKGNLGFAICEAIGTPSYPTCELSELKNRFSTLFSKPISLSEGSQ